MDHARLHAQTQDASLHRALQGSAFETPATEALSASDDPETSRRDAVQCSAAVEREREPLLERPRLVAKTASSESVRGARGPPNGKLLQDGGGGGDRPALHVQFSSAAPERGSLSSSSSSSDEESLSVAEARPPDGGWGWVVVFASFMVNLIADGVTFSFGVFYMHFLDYFEEGKAKTAWIASIFMAMPLLSGPIASFLTDRYGCRRMTVLGSLLAAFGFIVSAFVDDIETLFFTFGIMAGFGLSLCYVAAVVIVAYYFEKKRSLATGISVCGSGIGTFIFAPLTRVLLDEYGWRGTTLIMAGFFLNMCVCGLLMRDLPWTTTMIEAKARDRKRSREQKRNKRYGSSADSFSDSKSSTAASGPTADTALPPVRAVPHFSSLVDLPTYVTDAEGVPLEVLELMSNRRHVYSALLHTYPGLMLPSRSFSDSGRLHETSPPPVPPPPPPASGKRDPIDAKAEYLAWVKRSQVANSKKVPPAFLKDLRVHRHSLTYRGAMLNINRYRLRASSCPNIFRNSMTTIAKEKLVWYAGLWDLWDLVKDVLDFSHFRDPKFLLFALSNFLLYMWYDVPYVYIADSAEEIGFTESQGSMLISTIGIVNMLGEIVLGWAGDWEFANAGLIYAVCMLFCGGVTAVMPLLKDYLALSASCGAFGFFIAANYSLTSIILVELITLEKFTNAYGLLLLIQGIANLLGPPLAGYAFDETGVYDLSFYLAGVFIAASGLFMFVLPVTNRVRRMRASRRAPLPPPPAATALTSPAHRAPLAPLAPLAAAELLSPLENGDLKPKEKIFIYG